MRLALLMEVCCIGLNAGDIYTGVCASDCFILENKLGSFISVLVTLILCLQVSITHSSNITRHNIIWIHVTSFL